MKKNLIWFLFFVAYAVLLIIDMFVHTKGFDTPLWLVLFLGSALISYWAHRTTGIVTISLLFVHIGLELYHHGGSLTSHSMYGMIMLGLHSFFDFSFLWSEVRHHTKNYRIIFTTLCMFFLLIFSAGILQTEHSHHETELLESILAGGIFACVLSHGISAFKKIHTRNRYFQ